MNNYNIILTQQEYAALRPKLQAMHIAYEPSACGEDVYFAITCTADQAEALKQIIDTI